MAANTNVGMSYLVTEEVVSVYGSRYSEYTAAILCKDVDVVDIDDITDMCMHVPAYVRMDKRTGYSAPVFNDMYTFMGYVPSVAIVVNEVCTNNVPMLVSGDIDDEVPAFLKNHYVPEF